MLANEVSVLSSPHSLLVCLLAVSSKLSKRLIKHRIRDPYIYITRISILVNNDMKLNNIILLSFLSAPLRRSDERLELPPAVQRLYKCDRIYTGHVTQRSTAS
jgi:hypothetical protein